MNMVYSQTWVWVPAVLVGKLLNPSPKNTPVIICKFEELHRYCFIVLGSFKCSATRLKSLVGAK